MSARALVGEDSGGRDSTLAHSQSNGINDNIGPYVGNDMNQEREVNEGEVIIWSACPHFPMAFIS